MTSNLFRRAFVAGCALALACASVPGLLAQSSADVTVREAWAREATTTQPSTAAYLVLDNKSPRAAALVGVKVAVAGTAELHTMTMKPGSGMSGMGGGRDMMTMEKVNEIAIPAGATVELRPGSFHIMLFKLTKAIAAGDSVDLVLEFKDGSTKTVPAKVQTRASVGYQK